MEEIARYGWVDGSPLSEAACVTFVESMDLVAVAAAFGGSLEEAVDVTFDGDYEPDYENETVVLRQVGDWVVAIEDNGWQGSRPEVLRRLSGGRAVSCNVWFRHAVGGVLRTRFNGYAPGQAWGADAHALDALVAELPIPRPGADGGGQAVGLLTLAARMTGIELAASALDVQWRVHRLL